MAGRVGPLAGRLGISIGLLALLVIVADPRRILAQVADARLIPLLVTIAFTLGDRVLMAFKWSLLLRARGVTVPFWTAVRAYFSASFVGLFLPVTIGADAVRVLALRQHGTAEIAASVVIERALGMVAVASVALAGSLLIAAMTTTEGFQSITLVVMAIASAGGVAFLASLPLASRIAERSIRVPPLLKKVAAAYGRYRGHPGTLGVFYALSVVESLVPALINYAAARAIGLAYPLDLFIVTVPLALAIARLPISLGGFGVQEAAFVYLAGLLGLSSADALSIMLVADAALLVALIPAAFDGQMLNLRRKAAPEAVL